MVWNYIVGGAGDQTTLRDNRDAFVRWALRARPLTAAGSQTSGQQSQARQPNTTTAPTQVRRKNARPSGILYAHTPPVWVRRRVALPSRFLQIGMTTVGCLGTAWSPSITAFDNVAINPAQVMFGVQADPWTGHLPKEPLIFGQLDVSEGVGFGRSDILTNVPARLKAQGHVRQLVSACSFRA